MSVDAHTGAVAMRDLDDGRRLWLIPMIFTYRLVIGDPEADGYDDAWCYGLLPEAAVGMATWDGEGDPPGRWIRHVGSARRRHYNGDGSLEREWVAP